jgi:hypothetical protein
MLHAESDTAAYGCEFGSSVRFHRGSDPSYRYQKVVPLVPLAHQLLELDSRLTQSSLL